MAKPKPLLPRRSGDRPLIGETPYVEPTQELTAPGPARKQTVNSLNLYTPAYGVTDGYGNSAEQMCIALDALGIYVTIAGLTMRCGHMNAEEILRRPPRMADNIIFYAQPWAWNAHGSMRRKSIGFSMYECDALPAYWYEKMRLVDEIWVPGTWCKEVFAQHVPEVPVKVVPLGVNAWHFPYKRRVRGEKLRFLHFSTVWSEFRKGAQLAIDGFKQAFPDRTDVALTVHSTKAGSSAWSPNDERIQFRGGMLTTAQLCQLYYDYDALIFPSRGEGFGMIPLETMATGMATIFSCENGMRDFGAGTGIKLVTRKTTAWVGEGRGTGRFMQQGSWDEPLLDSVVDAYHKVDKEYEKVMDAAARDAEMVREIWTWERTARVIQARLEGWEVDGLNVPGEPGVVSHDRRLQSAGKRLQPSTI